MRFRGRGRRGGGAAVPPLPRRAGGPLAPSAETRVPAARAQRRAFQRPGALALQPRGPLPSARLFEAPARPLPAQSAGRSRRAGLWRGGGEGLRCGARGCLGAPALPPGGTPDRARSCPGSPLPILGFLRAVPEHLACASVALGSLCEDMQT